MLLNEFLTEDQQRNLTEEESSTQNIILQMIEEVLIEEAE